MANRSVSSSEQYTKRSNRFLWLLGLGIIILVLVGYCTMNGGSRRRGVAEDNPIGISELDPLAGASGADLPEFGTGNGQLEAQPASVTMDSVVLGSEAEAIITMTAKESPIVFMGMDLADTQQDGFTLGGTCEPNKVIAKDGTCTVKVMWNPLSLRQIQNTLLVRWRVDHPGVFSDSELTIPLKAQSTDSKDCVICETPCKDKDAERQREASLFNGESGTVNDKNEVEIGGETYKVKGNLLVDKDDHFVGIVEPERIPIDINNKMMGTISKTGDVTDADGKAVGRLVGDDTIVDSSLKVLGSAIPVVSVLNEQGRVLGVVTKEGTVVDGSKTVIGRPLVDGTVVNLAGEPIGYLEPQGLVINWLGQVIGGILPNGSIVNESNQTIGSIQPNGLAVDPDGELIGGVIPRGIAVGAACKALGRIMPNGQVKDGFSQVIGHTLLNGAVVDANGVDVGTAIRMGLVINEKGNVIGFVNSEGKVVDGKGSVIGCVNPDGTVSAGTKILGAVMPRGHVMGRGCQGIGSVYPNGVVMNAAVEVVGQVRPDSHVVNVNHRIIGVVVPRGAAIADGCRFLGLITPEGYVMDENGLIIGCMNPEKQIIDKQEEVIGFVAPMGLVVSPTGKVIGRTRLDGKVIDNDGNVIGCVNSDGTVTGQDGKTPIGILLGAEPGDGAVLNENGDDTGLKVVGTDVYGPDGQKVGRLLPNNWVVNDKDEIIAVVPPDGVIFGHDGVILGRYSRKTGMALTPSGERFGYVLPDYSVLNTEKNTVIGLLVPDKTAFMDPKGGYLATMTVDGILQNQDGESLGVIKSDGTVVNRAGQTVGVRIPQGKVFSVTGREVGTVNGKGEVISAAQTVIGHVLGNGLAISNDGRVLGGIFPDISLPIGADGLLGALTYQGKINDARGRQIGVASPFGTIYSERENISGRLLRIGPYVDSTGQLIGWANFKGGINDKSGNAVGTVSVTGVALNADNQVLGTLVPRGIVVSENGSYLTAVSTNGQVLTANGQNIGLMNGYTYVFNNKDGVVGQLLQPGVAVNADGGFIGWTRFDGAVEDGQNVIGHVTLDGQVVHTDGSVLGAYIPLGTLVMADKTGFMGLVDGKGQVVNGRGDKVASVTNQTYAVQDGRIVGRLMQKSLAVKDNVNGRLSGMAGADGIVMVVNNNKPLGNLTANGLVVDLTKKVVAGLSPVGLPIGTKLGLMGIPLPTGQILTDGQESGTAVGTGSGAVYDSQGQLIGGILSPATFIDRNGVVIGRSSGTVEILGKDGHKLAEYMPYGSALTPDTIWAGGALPVGQVVNDDGYDIGVIGLDGTISGKEGLLMGRILSDGSAVGLSDRQMYSTMPYVGHVIKQGLPFSYRNQVMGRTTVTGDIVDAADKKVYRELDDGSVLGKDLPIDGMVLSFNPATGHDGQVLGMLDGEGKVVSYAGEEVGQIAVNGAVKGTHKYRILGGLVPEQLVVNECKVLGQVSFNGQVINGQGNAVGRVTPDKWAVDGAENRIGRAAQNGLVASISGDYLGRTLPDSTVVDVNGIVMGCARNDGTVVNGSGDAVGHVVERGLAIDPNGGACGRIKHNGIVVDGAGKIVGKVIGDGKGSIINQEGEIICRVVTPDEELMFDSRGNIRGSFGRNGMFKDPKGNEQFQVLPNGDIIDPKTRRKIATLTDDDKLVDPNGNEVSDIRVVRDPDGNFIGLILDNGDIVGFDGTTKGKLGDDGIVRDLNDNVISDVELFGIDLEKIAPALMLGDGPGAMSGDRRIFLGGEMFNVTPQGSLIDKDGNIIGYMGEDGRPYSLDDRALSGTGGPTGRPDIKKPIEVPQEHKDAMDSLLATRRAAMKSKIRSYERMLPDVRTLARARKKQDLDWGEPKIVSSYPVDMSRMILKDKAIPAVLAHSIDSRHASVPVTAIVERHIYAEQGRRIIIPAGSRLIGSAGGGGGGAGGSHVNKMEISWTRLIRPDGSAFTFSATSGDAQGRGGVAAYLDEQLLKKYGRPVLQSTLTSAIAFVTATNDDITNKDNGDQVMSSRAQAANDARSNFIDSMSQIFQQLLNESMNIDEVVFVPAGTRLTVFSNSDLWLRSEIEDEQDYLAAYGADTKKARPASKGNWIDPRSGEMSELASERGIATDIGGGSVVVDDGVGYYNPDYETIYTNRDVLYNDRAGMGGGAAIYNGETDTDNQAAAETAPATGSTPSVAVVPTTNTGTNRQVVNPIFPRTQQQTDKKLF